MVNSIKSCSTNETEAEGFIRLPDVLRLFPVSKAKWWRGVKDHIYPAPYKLGPRVTAWRRKDIYKLISDIENGDA